MIDTLPVSSGNCNLDPSTCTAGTCLLDGFTAPLSKANEDAIFAALGGNPSDDTSIVSVQTFYCAL